MCASSGIDFEARKTAQERGQRQRPELLDTGVFQVLFNAPIRERK
jgi:hypothetical protein